MVVVDRAFDDALASAEELNIDKILARSIWETWRKADSDGTGKLDRKEAQAVFEQLLDVGESGAVDVGALFDEADKNDDNAVTFGEFVVMLQNVSAEKDIPIGALLLRAHLLDPKFDKDLKMPKLQIKRHLESEMEQMDACKELVPSMLLFIVFLASFILHETPSLVHNQHFALHFDINENANFAFGGGLPFDNGRMGHKALQDVNTFADFWSWLNLGFSPLVFHGSWDQNEVLGTIGTLKCSHHESLVTDWGFVTNATDPPVPAYCDQIASLPQTEAEAGMYLFYNRILGGLRLQQESGEEIECPVSEGLRKTYGRPCWKSIHDLETEIPESFRKDYARINKPGFESVFFLVPGSLGDVRTKFKELEDKKWAGPATQAIEIAFPTYNANWGTVTMTYIHFFVNRGGHFWKQIVTGTVWLDLYHAGFGTYIVDGVWAWIILKTFFGELKDVIGSCVQLGPKKGLQEYIGFWNFVDWISVIGSFSIFFFLAMHAMKASSLTADIEAYDYTIPGGYVDASLDPGVAILSGDVGMNSLTAALMTKIEDLVQHARLTRILFAFYSYIVGLKLFKAFAAQPRLALVTMTIMRASLDIVHFGLVFFSTIGIFAASAMALFGNELQMFSTYTRAFGATMRCLLGDFDWTSLDEVGHFLAAFWFWSFQIIVVNIMFNMLLAMIMDTYGAVKAQTENAETLWGQGYEIYRRWKGKVQGKRLGLDQVLKIMAKNESDEAEMYREITANEFMAEIPGMKINQANRLIGNTHDMIEEENHVDVTLDDIMNKQTSVESMTKAIYKGLQIVIDHSAGGTQAQAASASGGRTISKQQPASRSSAVRIVEETGESMPKGAPAPSEYSLEERFGALEGRLGTVETKMEERFSRIEDLLKVVTSRNPSEYSLEGRFSHMEVRFGKVEERLRNMESPLSKMQKVLGNGASPDVYADTVAQDDPRLDRFGRAAVRRSSSSNPTPSGACCAIEGSPALKIAR